MCGEGGDVVGASACGHNLLNRYGGKGCSAEEVVEGGVVFLDVTFGSFADWEVKWVDGEEGG